jgi:hypothetical protein
VWQKASDLLADFRTRMTAAALNPDDVEGLIVYIRASAPDDPLMTLLSEGHEVAIHRLSAPDVLVLGMIFRQLDGGQAVDFPMQFTGLSERGLAVLKKAAELQHRLVKLTAPQNLN